MVYIIAEAGVNHNGDMKIAKSLINKAKKYCNQQVSSMVSECLVTRQAKKAEYQVRNTNDKGTQYEMLKMLELKNNDHVE